MLSPTITQNVLSSPSEPLATLLVKIMPGGVFGHQMSLESFVTLTPISAPTCVSVCIWAPQGWLRHILQETATFQSTMPLWLLGCGAPGTLLIIYLACVYLCWTRLSGGGSQKEKQIQFCQPACVEPANPEGLPALWRCAFLCTGAHVWETEVATM